MIRAIGVARRAEVRPERIADTVTLDHDGRRRRRMRLVGEGGLSFVLDLERVTPIEDGDALVLEDGRLVRVRAAPEALLEARAADRLSLMRIAWHIGNRHVAAEIAEDVIAIEADEVLAEMIIGLGGAVTRTTRPFRPERGAYDRDAGPAHTAHTHSHESRSHSHD